MFKRAIGKPSKADVAYRERVREIGCICCRHLGLPQIGATEIHHCNDAGRNRGHREILPLCEYHHRGSGLKTSGRAVYGPAVSDGAKAFRARWGHDDELIFEVNREIGD